MIKVDEPLILRPSRKRFLAWTSVLAVWVVPTIILVLVVYGTPWEGRLPSALFLWALCFGPSFLAVPCYLGSTRVDADGVTRCLGRSRRHFSWAEVEGISFTIAPMGWAGYWMVLRSRTGRSAILPAPVVGIRATDEELVSRLEPVYARAGEHRERVAARPVVEHARRWGIVTMVAGAGLVVLQSCIVLLSTSPWEQSWWPTRQEASALPAVCSAVERDTAVRLVPGAGPGERADASGRDRSCRWEADGRSLTVRLMMEEPGFIDGNGSAERAGERYADLEESREGFCLSLFMTVGDESCVFFGEDGAERRPVELLARQNNVIVEVAYRAGGLHERPDEEMEIVADELFRKVRFS